MEKQTDHLDIDAVRARRDYAIWREGFDHAHAEWSLATSELKPALLLTGKALADAESWLLAHDSSFTQLERQFIYKSISQASQSRARDRWMRAEESREMQKHRVRLIVAMAVVSFSILAPGLFNLFVLGMLHDRQMRSEADPAPPQPKQIVQQQQPQQRQAQQSKPSPENAAGREPSSKAATRTAKKPEPDQISPAAAALLRRQELVDLSGRLAAKGDKRASLLLAIEAADEAIKAASEPATARAKSAPAGKAAAVASGHKEKALLFKALAARQQLAARRAFVQTAATPLFCRDASVVISAPDSKLVQAWQVSGGHEKLALDGRRQLLQGAALDAGCRHVAMAAGEYDAVVWSLADGRRTLELKGHEADVVATAFSPDGRRIATSGQDRSVRIWDAANGRQVAVMREHDDTATALAFSPDGRRLISGANDKTARIWDAASGRRLAVLDGHQGFVRSVAFSPDGGRVLTVSWDGYAGLWDAESGKLIARMQGERAAALAAEISPDGALIAVLAQGTSVYVFDGTTGARLAELPGHAGPLRALAFSPDSQLLAAMGWGSEARVWPARGGEPVAVLGVGDERMLAVTFRPDSRALIALAGNGEIFTWPVFSTLDDALAQARRAAPDCFSDAERKAMGLRGDVPQWCSELGKKSG